MACIFNRLQSFAPLFLSLSKDYFHFFGLLLLEFSLTFSPFGWTCKIHPFFCSPPVFGEYAPTPWRQPDTNQRAGADPGGRGHPGRAHQ